MFQFLLKIPKPEEAFNDWRFIALVMNAALATNLMWLLSHPETPPADWMFLGSTFASLWEFEVFVAPFVFKASVSILVGTLLAALTYLWFRISRKSEMPPQGVRTMLTLAFGLSFAFALPHAIGAFVSIDIVIANLAYLLAITPDEVLLSTLAKYPTRDVVAFLAVTVSIILVQAFLIDWMLVRVWRTVPKIFSRGGLNHEITEAFPSKYGSGD